MSRRRGIQLCSPAKAGPIKRSSWVLKPFSPVPTKNMIEPREIVPKPGVGGEERGGVRW